MHHINVWPNSSIYTEQVFFSEGLKIIKKDVSLPQL